VGAIGAGACGRLPNFFAALEIAACSDLVMTLPESLARMTIGAARFVMLPPPVDPGPIALNLLWHARHQDAPRHVWLRSLIVAAARSSEAVLASGGGAAQE